MPTRRHVMVSEEEAIGNTGPVSAPVDRYMGAYALCLAADRLLLARNSTGHERGTWTLPGGGVEPGEHPDDAVCRELTEETGLSGRIERIAGVYFRHYPTSHLNAVAIDHVGVVYNVIAAAGELRAEIDGTTDLCAWLTRAEVADLPLTSLAEYGVGLVWPE